MDNLRTFEKKGLNNKKNFVITVLAANHSTYIKIYQHTPVCEDGGDVRVRIRFLPEQSQA